MANKNERPVFLNLLQIRLPITGVVSILHRVSGVVLVLILPVGLLLLERSLEGPEGFEACRRVLASGPIRIVVLVVLWLLLQHFFAGVRHLLLDLDICVERVCARRSAWLILAGSLLAAAAFGVL